MSPSHAENSMRRSASGFTLLEVVVGLVLMATLLVSILLATIRHKQSQELAVDRLVASRIADEMLATWFDSRDGVPLQDAGSVVGYPHLAWRTAISSNRSVFGQIMPVVKLDVVSQRPNRKRATLVSVEVLANSRTRITGFNDADVVVIGGGAAGS